MSADWPSTPPGVSTTTGAAGVAHDVGEVGAVDVTGPEVGVPVGAGVELVAAVVAVHQVDPAGDGAHLLDDAAEVGAAGVGVAGVEAEADGVAALGPADRLPEPLDRLEPAGHRVVTAGGVLDEQRHRHLEAVDALAPVVEADVGVLVLAEVAAVHDDALGADLGRRGEVLLEQLAAGDADPVVRRRDVDRVGRVHVEVDAGIGRRLPQRRGTAGELHDRPLVALRVAEEELAQRGPPGGGLRHRVGLVDVPSDAQLHGPHGTAHHRRRGWSRPVAG